MSPNPRRLIPGPATGSIQTRRAALKRILKVVLPARPASWGSVTFSATLAFFALALIAIFQEAVGNVQLVGALGGSAIIAFGVPESSMARARSLFGGHAVACSVGMAVTSILPESSWVGALGVGCALGVMQLTATTHSPAGADPLLIAVTHGAWARPMIVLFAGLAIISLLAQLRGAVSNH